MKKAVLKFVVLIVATCLCSIFIFYHVERAKPVSNKIDILQNQFSLEEKFLDSYYTVDNPKIIVNPYGISPLSALIIFTTHDLTTPTVTIHGKTDKTTYTHTFTPAKQHILPIYGLYPGTENKVTISINNKKYQYNIKTDNLPDDFILPPGRASPSPTGSTGRCTIFVFCDAPLYNHEL